MINKIEFNAATRRFVKEQYAKNNEIVVRSETDDDGNETISLVARNDKGQIVEYHYDDLFMPNTDFFLRLIEQSVIAEIVKEHNTIVTK